MKTFENIIVPYAFGGSLSLKFVQIPMTFSFRSGSMRIAPHLRSTRLLLPRTLKPTQAFPQESHGQFKRLLHPVSPHAPKSLTVVTCNARELSCQNFAQSITKTKVTLDSARNIDVIGIQEVHGDSVSFDRRLALLKKTHWTFFDPGPCFATGGMLTAIRMATVPSLDSIRHEVLSAFRVLRTSIQSGENYAVYYNIHNFDIPARDMTSILERINIDIREAHSHPQRVSVWIFGDFNLQPEGFCKLNLKHLDSDRPVSRHTVHSKFHPAKWASVFSVLVEFDSPNPTHFWPGSLTLGKHDRIFTSISPSALTSLTSNIMVLHDPVFLHRQGISDHAPLVVTLSMRPRADPATLPIHRECCSHKRFSERLHATCDSAALDDLPNSERL